MALFAVSIFLSAFLLFQIQPMIGKVILPWIGGTPAVWSTVMLFFQVLLTGIENTAVAETLTSVLIFLNKFYKIDGAGIRITGEPGEAA